MDTTDQPINHLSLCSGYSGIGLGLKRVLPTLREVCHVEVEAYAIANLCDKMQTGALVPAPIWTDLKTFNFSAFRESMEQGILSGGFPCQPFSSAGLRKATEDPRHLWPYILEGIKQCRPAIIFLENVEGIISAKTGEGESVLKYVLRSLEEVGYRVTAGLFSAAEVGAPHQRKRVFILGHASSTRLERAKRPQSEGKRNGLTFSDTSKELGHADSSRKQQCKKGKQEVRGWSEQTSKEMANADSEGLERRNRRILQKCSLELPVRQRSTQSKRWPSGPNEDQHEWEEPRAISKQQMGRTANGAPGRVDSLRLLGNGVVPQTVEIAFRTLLTEITNQ